MQFSHISIRLGAKWILFIAISFLSSILAVQPAVAQTENAAATVPPEELLKQLMNRLSAAEAKIQQLESEAGRQTASPVAAPQLAAVPVPQAAIAAAPVASPAPQSASNDAPALDPQPAASPGQEMDHMMQVPDGPALHIRGFFDFNFDKGSVAQQLEYPLPLPGVSTFRAGEFDLFMTSQLSEKLSFVSELVFATDQTNNFGLDIERFQLTFRPSKYFEISAGRFHTDIGYYNTTFHHGNWFSTATGRPFMYYFEDAGGVLPVHEVGVTTTGLVPGSGKLDLHWTAEVGNGSSEFGSANFGDGVENFVSDRNRKDVNVAFYSRPEWVPGLQVGGSFLTGDLIPASGLFPKVNQNISSAYVVFTNSKWEFMNEAAWLRHQIPDGRTYNSPLGYTQLAYRIARYRPYFRFQEVNIPTDDPSTSFKGRYEGPSFGVRFDPFDYAAFKLQYNRVYVRTGPPENGLEAQLAFTF